MAKSNLLKEAIADAKAVRETAIANAKIALEEAFTPKLQSMLSRKNIVGNKFYPFFLNDIESVDVDTELDFKIAEFIYNERLQQR